jgi:hypothetical protein
MGVHYDQSRRKYVVRWTTDGRRQIRRFDTEAEAISFAQSVVMTPRGRPTTTGLERNAGEAGASAATIDRALRKGGDGIYSYETCQGARWRFTFRQSDGTMSSRRGFTSRKAAADAKRRLLEGIRRGEVRVSRETFETFWQRVLRDR